MLKFHKTKEDLNRYIDYILNLEYHCVSNYSKDLIELKNINENIVIKDNRIFSEIDPYGEEEWENNEDNYELELTFSDLISKVNKISSKIDNEITDKEKESVIITRRRRGKGIISKPQNFNIF